MKHISNETKAKEIATRWKAKGLPYNAIYDTAIEAMEWKEKQLIDRLEDWLANNICTAHNFRGDNISATFMNDCIKAMKGE